MEINWELEAELALRAVGAASEFLQSQTEAPKTSQKENHKDIVTQYDLACEKIIKEILAPSQFSLTGEESHQLNDNKVGSTWFIDPIDGTSNFSTGFPLYATSVGLYHHDKFALGAVGVPAHRELFFTFGNQGSYLNGKLIKTQAHGQLKNSLVAISFSSSSKGSENRKKEYALFGELNDKARTTLRLGSAAVNICYTADNRLQAACGFHAKLWDIAGGIAIAAQAGCKIILNLNMKQLTANYIVASPTVADEIFAVVNEKGYFNE